MAMRPLFEEIHYIQKALAGNRDAFGALVKQYQDHVYRTVYARVGNPEDALDLAQETFLAAYENLKTLRDPAKFKAWLTRIAVNRCHSWRRGQSRQVETLSITETAPEVLEDALETSAQRQQQCDQLWEAVNALSPVNREVVVLYYFSGLSYDEIAEQLGVPTRTVDSRLQEARKKLRKEFASMVIGLRLKEQFAPENFTQKVMEGIETLPAPVPTEGIVGKIGSLISTHALPTIGVATFIIAATVGVTFTPLRNLLPGAQAQLADTKIAFMSNRDGNWEVYVMNADGSNPVNVTKSPAADGPHSWSPDRTKIAFASDRNGNTEIYVMDADGKNPINLTQHPANDFFPSWSPDGRKIAFVSNRDGNMGIYVMDADGKNQINLTKNPAGDDVSSWSPDGRKIAFASDRDGNGEIYVMDADGKNQINLTKNPADDYTPSWSPVPKLAVSLKEGLATLWGKVKRGW
ncbi:sigma-70 family RNA polymerase sigma factor [Candidatus Poribacteria bacterium]|nr:sigma-70 family RNA polymerase sigma factor [Candidatus Poribacteria bacterium]